MDRRVIELLIKELLNLIMEEELGELEWFGLEKRIIYKGVNFYLFLLK